VAENDTDAERTEQPTAKRLQEARERGQVARSRELGTAAVMMAGSATLLMAGGPIGGSLGRLLSGSLSIPREALHHPEAMTHALGGATLAGLLAALPVFLAVTAAAILAPLAHGGWVFSPQAIAPNFDRLNPVSGLGRIFGLQGLSELVKALLKFVVVGVIAGGVGLWLLKDALALGMMAPGAGIAKSAHILGLALLLMSAGLIVIAAVDAPFQWWQHHRQLKMTREEIREEMKETDGRPEVKQKIRELQRKYSKRRMMQDVPRADVVVTNPTHYAVALKYDARRMKAPRVLAKGRDLVALEIRRLAEANRVPVFEAPPLARVLYGSTDVGREIPQGLYLAVAQVLSYVYQLKTLSPTLAARLRRPKPTVDPALAAKYDRDAGVVA
jgi:flagellar biosynthetic protein FlhB